MAKRTMIQPTLFQCPSCKKKYFSYLERMWCPECSEEKDKSAGSDDADESEDKV